MDQRGPPSASTGVTGIPMNTPTFESLWAALPKAELHVHLEGSVAPETMVELAARHGVTLTEEEAAARYAPGDFARFIESYI